MEGAIFTVESFASLDCTACPIWDGTVNAAAIRSMPMERMCAVRDALLTHGTSGGLLGILRSGLAENPFVAFGRKMLEDERPEMLVGCGPGLTPAGDDFLTGALLASQGSALPPAGIERALAGTTAPGRTLLWMALQDRFPAYLVKFVDDVLAADSTAAVTAAVRAACAHGETSGTDALAGFCWQKLAPR
jgi:hypothetical protein